MVHRLCLLNAVIAGIIALAPQSFAAAPVYRPVVGQHYDYGIEFRIAEQAAEDRPAIEDRQRCRLRFVVTAIDAEGWTATYQTIPFHGVKIPGSKESYQRSVQRSRDALDGKGLASRSNTVGNPLADRLRERSQLIRQQFARIKVMKVDTYPGLFMHCSGNVRVSRQGEVLGI